jgi:hypothetical protein
MYLISYKDFLPYIFNLMQNMREKWLEEVNILPWNNIVFAYISNADGTS